MKNPIEDSKFRLGLLMFTIGFIIFLAPLFIKNSIIPRDSPFPFFWNFASLWIYFFVAMQKRFKFPNRHNNILLLLIGNLSAYSLNNLIPVFDISTNWLASYLVVLNGGMILYCFRQLLPEWIEYSLTALLFSGLFFNLYECLYVIPFYPISLMAFWFFLIPLHIFIPLWWVVLLTRMILPYFDKGTPFLYSLVIGGVLPLAMAIGFTAQWHGINQQIKAVYDYQPHSQLESSSERILPPWVDLSKVLQKDWKTEKILKSRFFYTIAKVDDMSLFPNNRSLNERRKHDPFVVIASLFSTPLKLDGQENLKLINAVFNQRHQTERKLWSGNDLRTEDVQTTIEFFPEYRLAYTEKVIQIANKIGKERLWRNQQEALYSFYLPEGSVVTSASLWVAGEERPSFLTTRNKADSAYTTIVGREKRDPLVLHWQEGNRVTVRVFPVTPQENRQFKIGITSPLAEKDGQLIYQNPDFDGPYWANATETIRIIGATEELSLLSSLSFSKEQKDWVYEGQYTSDWELTLNAPELINTTFSFNDQHFQLQPYYPQTMPFEAQSIYLDINESWSKKEFNTIWEQVKYQPVYVFTDQLVRLSPNNKDRLFKKLNQYNFNLFPFYKIVDPPSALVITKTEKLSPVLNDLKGSPFANQLNDFFGKEGNTIKVFDLGGQPSLYYKGLTELRCLQHHTGELSELQQFLKEKIFIQPIENESLISLPNMGLTIQKINKNSSQSNGPDHLMRLFTYNDLMKKIGRNYFKKEKLADQLVAQAEAGFVVSPVSSLLVLETQADYDRFDIKRSENSLKNASIKNAGSVPEPHEWLLIVLSLLVAGSLWWKL